MPGKIEVDEVGTFLTNSLIGINCFARTTQILYRIVKGNNITLAYIFNDDVIDVEFQ